MFRSIRRDAGAAGPDRPRQPWRRAALFGASLVLLWLALQAAPARTPRDAAAPYVEASAPDQGVTVRSQPPEPRLFTTGTLVAVLLLIGGGGVALYLRRRSRDDGALSASLRPLGHLTLAPNQQLRLVRCGDDALLLGVTAGQITLLKCYPVSSFDAAEAASKEEKEEAIPVVSVEAPGATASGQEAFAALLRRQGAFSLNVQYPKRP